MIFNNIKIYCGSNKNVKIYFHYINYNYKNNKKINYLKIFCLDIKTWMILSKISYMLDLVE
jgi:hypothetical protein